MKKVVITLICLCLLFGSFACAVSVPGESTEKQTEKTVYTTETAAGSPTEKVTEAQTDPASEAPTETTPYEIADGMMVYYEDFSSYGSTDDTETVLDLLGWRILNVFNDFAPSDWTAKLSISGGELIVTNYVRGDDTIGSDGYAQMLSPEYMKSVEEYGLYTLQYDVTYTSAANYKRYINIVTEYDEDAFNSFHFRIGGYGNNQCYYRGEWKTLDAADENDLYAGQRKNTDKNTTIAKKLLGIDKKIDSDADAANFTGVTVTIRVIHERGVRRDVYMKTADMSDFICVSRSSNESEGFFEFESITGTAVCFKTGGRINGKVDNIAIWTGSGDMPENKTITYRP